jgi:flavin reductase (DIM6/NTAB) family NADH-FMN oxidoreductase RutF
MTTETISFNQLFRQISPEDITDNVFTLTGKILPIITAGRAEHYNSMVASGGGMGRLFMKPTTWCILRGDRYTLELIQKGLTYTMSYFPKGYKKETLLLGSKSGRDSDKMKEVKLNIIPTPDGNISFTEARLIIECKLTQVTTPGYDDFIWQEDRNYISEEFNEANVYRKFVFGEITHVWIKKHA